MRYPVMLDVDDVAVLVVGGGPVGARKVRDLAQCGARVTLVAIDVGPEAAAAGATTVEQRAYRPGEAAEGYRLVVTATGVREVDAQVSADAQAAGVWVNAADDPPNCTFILPAVLRRGRATVMVSTDGGSPAAAGWLRDRLGEILGPELAAMIDDLAEQRESLLASGDRIGLDAWSERIERAAASAGVTPCLAEGCARKSN
ncbi:MAG: bifunctional precorrin-2 dehydrogenase/sirohydrochlorin ferrochelatase [Acidimicrobiia bacterium]